MRQNTRVTIAMRDLDRLKCIQAVVDGDLKLVRASERLGLTTRQVRRLAHRLDDALADQVIKILRSTYADFGPTLATESSEPSTASIWPRRPCGNYRSRSAYGFRASCAGAKDSAAAYQAGVHWGADPDRRLRASLVRKSRSCVHRVGLHRRCDESPDADLIQRN